MPLRNNGRRTGNQLEPVSVVLEVCSKVDREFVGERNWEFSMSSLRCADSRNQKGQLSVTKLIPLKQRRQGPGVDWWAKPRWDKVSPNRACSWIEVGFKADLLE